MIRYECDRCGARLTANDVRRFIVKIEIYAAGGPLELNPDEATDTGKSMAEVLASLRRADPDEIEDKTYRAFRFDICDACRKELLVKPLG